MTTETMHSEATHLPQGDDETVIETGSKRKTQKQLYPKSSTDGTSGVLGTS